MSFFSFSKINKNQIFSGKQGKIFFFLLLLLLTISGVTLSYYYVLGSLSEREAVPPSVVVSSKEVAVKSAETMIPPAGFLVYERPAGIYLADIENEKSHLLIKNGRHPRWSPNGNDLVFIRNNRVMVISRHSSTPRELAQAKHLRTVCFAPDGKSVFFADGKHLQEVNLKNLTIKTVIHDIDIREIGVSRKNKRIAVTVKTLTGYEVRVYHLEKNTFRTVSRGCSASISPDGKIITVNGGSHRLLHFYSWENLDKVGALKAPQTLKLDNQSWSNHPDWIVSTTEGENQDILIHNITTGYFKKITNTGDSDRGHLYLSE